LRAYARPSGRASNIHHNGRKQFLAFAATLQADFHSVDMLAHDLNGSGSVIWRGRLVSATVHASTYAAGKGKTRRLTDSATTRTRLVISALENPLAGG
jgi:hypothetical protein